MNFYEDSGPKPPCKKMCQERSVEPNCHSYCEKYLKYVEDYTAYKEQIRKNRELDDTLRGMEITRRRKRR